MRRSKRTRPLHPDPWPTERKSKLPKIAKVCWRLRSGRGLKFMQPHHEIPIPCYHQGPRAVSPQFAKLSRTGSILLPNTKSLQHLLRRARRQDRSSQSTRAQAATAETAESPPTTTNALFLVKIIVRTLCP